MGRVGLCEEGTGSRCPWKASRTPHRTLQVTASVERCGHLHSPSASGPCAQSPSFHSSPHPCCRPRPPAAFLHEGRRMGRRARALPEPPLPACVGWGWGGQPVAGPHRQEGMHDVRLDGAQGLVLDDEEDLLLLLQVDEVPEPGLLGQPGTEAVMAAGQDHCQAQCWPRLGPDSPTHQHHCVAMTCNHLPNAAPASPTLPTPSPMPRTRSPGPEPALEALRGLSSPAGDQPGGQGGSPSPAPLLSPGSGVVCWAHPGRSTPAWCAGMRGRRCADSGATCPFHLGGALGMAAGGSAWEARPRTAT